VAPTLEVGNRAPDFTLPSTEGAISLSERLKTQAVLLVFYPGDDTPVCTKQLCDYRDHLSLFGDLGVDVLAVNPQSLESHERFAKKHGDGTIRWRRSDLPIFRRTAEQLREVISELEL
jgi:peroxiredoxin